MTTTLSPYVLDNPPAPGSDEWTTRISASKVAPMIRNEDGDYAGFGYITAWQTWRMLKGMFTQDFNDFMLRKFDAAHEVEAHAAQWWISQQDNPDDWMLSDGEVTFVDPRYTFHGQHPTATPDYVATHLPTGQRTGIEVKNPDTPKVNNGWVIQSFCQHEWSGLDAITLIVWPSDGDNLVIPINPTRDQVNAIMADITAFSTLLDNNEEPAGGDLDLAEDIVNELKDAKQAVADAEARLEAAKAAALAAASFYKRGVYDGKVVITRTPGRFAKGRVPEQFAHLLNDEKFTKTSFDTSAFAKAHPDVYDMARGDDILTLK